MTLFSLLIALTGFFIFTSIFMYPNINGNPKRYGEKICGFGRDDTHLTYSTEVCVSWDSNDFLLAYSPLSDKETVINWLKTELHATIISTSKSAPSIHFTTNKFEGIFGFYVWDQIINQSNFTVKSLQDNIEFYPA